MKQAQSFEEKYPHITRWVKEQGWIEIGQDDYSSSFLRAVSPGGMAWEGRNKYRSMDDAFRALDVALKSWIKKELGE
jgi:hypothetical protein